jgi:hypothetical protein
VAASPAKLDAHIWTAVTLWAGTAAVLPEMAGSDLNKPPISARKVGKKDWKMWRFYGLSGCTRSVVMQSVFISFGK